MENILVSSWGEWKTHYFSPTKSYNTTAETFQYSMYNESSDWLSPAIEPVSWSSPVNKWKSGGVVVADIAAYEKAKAALFKEKTVYVPGENCVF